ncbi:hypothetical protein PV326_005745 [Microctonus aethiopoides]|nr:hypothetical protein PV326_005745 [Microctonus aethiopoides]
MDDITKTNIETSLPEPSLDQEEKATEPGTGKPRARPDGSYTWTLAETLELLMEEHFPGYKKPEIMRQRFIETGHGYKLRDWALAAKIIYPQGVE